MQSPVSTRKPPPPVPLSRRPTIYITVAFLVGIIYIAACFDYFQSRELSIHVGTRKNDCSPTNAQLTYSDGPRDSALAPVVIVMVMFGRDSAVEGLGAVKSVLMYLSRPLELHVVCSEEVPDMIDQKMSLISRPAYDIHISYYVLEPDVIRARATRAGIGTKHQAGLGGLVKVFLHEILYLTPRAIYFDTDMAFLVDPYLLWREFDRLTGEKMIAFPIQDIEAGPQKICTCIMLLDLKAMRRRFFMPSTAFPKSTLTLGSGRTWRKASIDPKDPVLGDQGLYWAVWRSFPQYFSPLSLSWDITHCHFSWGLGLAQGEESITEVEHLALQTETKTSPEHFGLIFPGILHFNCESAVSVWEDPDNTRRPRWGPYVMIVKRYKWVWLNRGDGSTKITTSVVNANHFHDEVMLAPAADSRPRKGHHAHAPPHKPPRDDQPQSPSPSDTLPV